MTAETYGEPSWAGFVHREDGGKSRMANVKFLLHSVQFVTRFFRLPLSPSGLDYCPKFGQASKILSALVFRACWRQLFNNVIHRIRGYLESICELNLLTRG